MSIEFNVFVGTFVEIETIYETEDVELMVCSDCSRAITSPYCPNCGGEAEQINTTDEYPADVLSWLEEHDLDGFTILGNDNDNCIVLNQRIDEKPLYFDKGQYDGDTNIHNIPERIPDEMFAPLISVLKENNIKYEIKHGIITYYT